MTDKERKMNNIHNAIREIYGENVRVEIVVTYDCMEVATHDRINLRDYSMRRINGEWVEKQ
jgi:hypothetical protein